MKDNLQDGLTKDWGGLSGLQNVLVNVGHEPRGSRGLLTTPRWWRADRVLIAEIDQCEATRTRSVGRP